MSPRKRVCSIELPSSDEKLAALEELIDDFAARAPRKELRPTTINFILKLSITSQLSTRQIEFVFEGLSKSLPVFSAFNFPKHTTISKVLGVLEPCNDYLAVKYLNSATMLQLCFDGSIKHSKSVLAALLINQAGEKYFFDARWSLDGTAKAHCSVIINMFERLANRASTQNFISMPADQWFKQQLSKIVYILSDSCNQALSTKKLLVNMIKNICEVPNKKIFIGDCGLHLAMNQEKHAAQALGPNAMKVLKTIQEKLAASTSLSNKSFCTEWQDHVSLDNVASPCKAKFTPNNGSRFSQQSRNSARIVIHMQTLIDFSSQHSSLTGLNSILSAHGYEIEEELLAFSLVWYFILDPMWIDMAKCKLPEAIEIWKIFSLFVTDLQNSDPVAFLTSPKTNKLIRAHRDNGLC